MMSSTITISLRIENAYELHDTVITEVTDAVIHVFQLTGTGHEDGDSFYDVTVTACSDPSLIGQEFDWGY